MELIEKQQGFWKSVIKGSLYALSFSLILVLVFAFLLRFFAFSDGLITVIIEIIKGASVLGGTIIAMKKCKEMGFLTGLVIGIAFTLLSFTLFSILDSFTFELSRTLLNDLLFGSIIGGISGIIAVNLGA